MRYYFSIAGGIFNFSLHCHCIAIAAATLQRKHYNKSDTSQDDDLRRPEEECEPSDEEDWRITVEDEAQCDDNEVSLSDDDRELPTKRQRISL